MLLWSIGNEIPDRAAASGQKYSRLLADRVRALDGPFGGRPVTATAPFVTDADDGYFAPLDLAGYNYSPQNYVSDHARKPARIMVGTESFPDQSFAMWRNGVDPHPWVIGDFIWTAIDYLGESSIGHTAVAPSLDAAAGNEPWPWHVSFCGDLDLVGHAKPQGLYRRVLWGVDDAAVLVARPLAPGQTSVVSAWG